MQVVGDDRQRLPPRGRSSYRIPAMTTLCRMPCWRRDCWAIVDCSVIRPVRPMKARKTGFTRRYQVGAGCLSAPLFEACLKSRSGLVVYDEQYSQNLREFADCRLSRRCSAAGIVKQNLHILRSARNFSARRGRVTTKPNQGVWEL